jgi:hypothetical protein
MLFSSLLLTILAGPAPTTSYEQSQRDLVAATEAIADREPAESIASLEASLAEATQHPHELLADPNAAEVLARARLALAWSQLANGETESAAATMDLAIRSAGSKPLPLGGLGPAIRQLHDDRRTVLEAAGHATITVDCDACEVLIDEAKSDNPSDPLLIGTHRVWLLDPHDRLEPRFQEVSLDTAEGTVALDYRPAAEPDAGPALDDDAGVAPVDATRRRDTAPTGQAKTPRWVKIVGMVAGAGLLATGGVLLAIDGKCRDGSTPTAENVDTCGKVWDHTAGSYALLGIGGGLLVGATVWLTVDEVRAGQPRRASALVGWTMRF